MHLQEWAFAPLFLLSASAAAAIAAYAALITEKANSTLTMHGKSLVDEWERQKANGVTRAQFAAQLGIRDANLKDRLRRARAKMRDQDDEPPISVSGPAETPAEYQEDGNRATASVISERITSPDELLDFLKIDLSVWEVERALVNKWEGYRKGERKALQYVDGKASGYVEDSGDLVTAPLFQVKIWLVRREPVALSPAVSPVFISVAGKPVSHPKRKSTRKRALILADPHFGFRRAFRSGQMEPFHDRRVLDVALQIAANTRIDLAILAGDILDLAEWSDKFVRSPEMYWTTQPAVIEAAWYAAQLRRLVIEMVVLEGNHDDRLAQALTKHFVQAYDLRPADRLEEPPPTTISGLLGLERLDIQHIADYPAGRYRINRHLVIEHGAVARATPAATANKVVDGSLVSVGFGHIHRQEMVARTIRDGDGPRTIFGFCPGCACRIDGIVPGSRPEQDWKNGLAIIDYDDTGDHAIHMVAVQDGKAFFTGHEYHGQDYAERLQEHLQPYAERERQMMPVEFRA